MCILQSVAVLVLIVGPSFILGQIPKERTELERSLDKAGYSIRLRTVVSVSAWEKERFDLQSKYRLEVRSRTHVPQKPNHFYRYTVDLEVFENDIDAVERLKNLKELPPGVDDKKGAEYLLRDGFRRGNRVYIISTNVAMFSYTGLTELKSQLERSIRR